MWLKSLHWVSLSTEALFLQVVAQLHISYSLDFPSNLSAAAVGQFDFSAVQSYSKDYLMLSCCTGSVSFFFSLLIILCFYSWLCCSFSLLSVCTGLMIPKRLKRCVKAGDKWQTFCWRAELLWSLRNSEVCTVVFFLWLFYLIATYRMCIYTAQILKHHELTWFLVTSSL